MLKNTNNLSPKIDQDDPQLHNRIFFRLFQVGNILQREAVKELGVTTVQWAVLGALSRAGDQAGISVGTLANYLVVSRQNLDGVLKRLERVGLVERVVDQTDRRAKLVRLTPEGKIRWAELFDKIRNFYAQATHAMEQNDKLALLSNLNKLQASLPQVRIPKKPDDQRKRAG